MEPTFGRLPLDFCRDCIGFAAFAAAALLAPGVHEYSPKRTIFDQIADCFSSLRQRKDPADRRLQLTFLQEFQEGCVRCSHRLLGEESEGEPADRCSHVALQSFSQSLCDEKGVGGLLQAPDLAVSQCPEMGESGLHPPPLLRNAEIASEND